MKLEKKCGIWFDQQDLKIGKSRLYFDMVKHNHNVGLSESLLFVAFDLQILGSWTILSWGFVHCEAFPHAINADSGLTYLQEEGRVAEGNEWLNDWMTNGLNGWMAEWATERRTEWLAKWVSDSSSKLSLLSISISYNILYM